MLPSCTGFGETDPTISRSATLMTLVLSETLLLAGLGSGVVELTVALLVMMAELTNILDKKSCGMFTLTTTVLVAPAVTVPRLQVRIVVPVHGPEAKTTPVGKVSLMDTLLASDGPALWTLMV